MDLFTSTGPASSFAVGDKVWVADIPDDAYPADVVAVAWSPTLGWLATVVQDDPFVDPLVEVEEYEQSVLLARATVTTPGDRPQGVVVLGRRTNDDGSAEVLVNTAFPIDPAHSVWVDAQFVEA